MHGLTCKILFIMRPAQIVSNHHEDTTFAMMREAQSGATPGRLRRPLRTAGNEWSPLFVRDTLTGEEKPVWFVYRRAGTRTSGRRPNDFGAVIMRKDHAFDAEVHLQHPLAGAGDDERRQVFSCCGTTLKTPRSWVFSIHLADAGHARRQRYQIFMPASGHYFEAAHCGWYGDFPHVKADGLNLGSIIETLNKNGAEA
jgi:glutathione synthase